MHDSKLAILTQYLARGWALVPLHDVSAGVCSCGRQCGASAGKHPRYARWQEPDQLIRDQRTLASLLGGGGADRWNWGVATGPISGIWVMDIDPASGGDIALKALVEELLEHDERIPQTLTLGPTGGGGRHLVFAWPTGGEVIHGSQTRNRYGFLPGLDVRGQGGQIVVAPSVSGKGAYGGVLIDVPVVAVGPALLARLTGGNGTGGGDRAPGGTDASAGPRTPATAALTPPGGDGGVGGLMAARHRAYAERAVSSLLAELRGAPVGTRNDAAFRVACRLLELANAPWSGVERDTAWWWWLEAASAHPDGVRVPRAELDSVWRSAAARIGDGAAAPPSDDGAWGAIGGTVIPFSLTSPAVGSANGGVPGVAVEAGQAVENGLTETQITGQTSETTMVVDPYEQAVRVEIGRIQVREEARRRIEIAKVGDPAARAEALAAAMVDTEGLDGLPELRPVVADLLYLDSCARIIGPSGHGKSFVALDLAGSVGAGQVWAGRDVTQGRALYLAAEGVAGIRKRVRAWEIRRGVRMTGVDFLPFAVQAVSPEWAGFVEMARRRRPSLIVLDTQARITVGVNENDASEMGVFVDAIERLRAATGACVLLVHHKGLNGVQGRGSTAVRAALQTELDVSKLGPLVSVATAKQKDGEEGPPVVFRLEQVNVQSDPFAPADLGGVLAWQPDTVAPGTAGLSDDELTGKVGEAALVARRVFATGQGGTKAEYRVVLMDSKEHSIKVSKATFYRVWADLQGRKIIGKVRGTSSWIYVPPERRAEMTEPTSPDLGEPGGFYAPSVFGN